MISIKKHLDDLIHEQFQASLLAYQRALAAIGRAAETLAGEDGKPLHETLSAIEIVLTPDVGPDELRQTSDIVERGVDEFARQRADIRRRKEQEYKQIIRMVAEAGEAMAISGGAQSAELLTLASRVEGVSRLENIAEIRRQLDARVTELKNVAARVHADGEAKARALQAKLGDVEAKLRSAERTAQTDALTGLGNRRLAEQAITDGIADGKPLSLVILDLNGFKLVNDRYGHAHGDRLLKAVAEGLRSSMRSGDVVCRWGGDEFVVILPGATQEEARFRAARLQASAFGEFMLEHEGRTMRLNVTACAGVTQYKNGETPEQFFERADQLLYDQKAELKKAARARISA